MFSYEKLENAPKMQKFSVILSIVSFPAPVLLTSCKGNSVYNCWTQKGSTIKLLNIYVVVAAIILYILLCYSSTLHLI